MRDARRRARVAAYGALGAAMVLPPLLLNGALGWTVVVSTALALSALGLAVAALRDDARSPGLALAVVAAAVLTALSVVPMPVAWARVIAPEATLGATRAAEAIGASRPTLVAFSLDPGGTRERTLAAVAVAAAFLAGFLHAGRDRARVLRLGVLAVAAVVVVTVAHAVAGVPDVYGVRPLEFTATPLVSPLVNRNHLGGFCAFGAILALGLAIDSPSRRERALAGTVALGASATVFATLSRGAMAALAVGVVGFAALLAYKARSNARLRGSRRTLAALGLAAAMLATAGHIGVGAVAGEYASDDYAKIDVQRRAVGLAARNHPWLGVGRGAFGAALASSFDGDQRFIHPESLPVQWATEWGFPFAAALLGTALLALGRAAAESRSVARIAGVSAVFALGLQNLVDFGLEMTGEAIVIAAIAGALVRPGASASGERVDAGERRHRPRARALAAATVAIGAVALAVLGPSVARRGALELEAALVDAVARRDARATRAIAEASVALHPLDPSFPMLAGAEAAMRGDPSAVRLLNRAMELAPLWAGPHEAAARHLASRGRLDQAALEVRAAEERVAGTAVRTACAILRTHPRSALAERMLPRDAVGRRRFANDLARCLPPDSPVSASLDAALLAESPEALEPAIRTARRALRAGDAAAALAALEPRESDRRADVQLALLLADARSALGRPDEAVTGLARAADALERSGSVSGERRVLEALALAEARAGREGPAAAAVARLRERADGASVALARAAITEGRVEELLGRPHSALRAYRRADGYDPSSGALERAATLARRRGLRAQALELDATLCLRAGPGSPACARRGRGSSAARLP